MSRIKKFIGFVLVLNGFVLAQNLNGNYSLSQTVKKYYAEQFGVKSQDIKLKFLHIPKIDLDKQYSVIQEKKIKLGHQTIWIEEDNTGESAPVTLDVSAYIPVFVANHTISRKEKLIPNMFTQKNWLLNRDFDRYVQDIREVEGTMSIQVIKKGKALTDSMIKNRPDIFKGDIVGVELISGNVTVETKGVVKKDGHLGRTAEVILDRTGKKVFGEIVGTNLVRVELN